MMLPHPMYSTALADAGQTSQKAGINELEIEVVPANPPFERVVTNVNGRCSALSEHRRAIRLSSAAHRKKAFSAKLERTNLVAIHLQRSWQRGTAWPTA